MWYGACDGRVLEDWILWGCGVGFDGVWVWEMGVFWLSGAREGWGLCDVEVAGAHFGKCGLWPIMLCGMNTFLLPFPWIDLGILSLLT